MFMVGHRQSGAMEYPSNSATIKPVAKRFSITMVLLLPELILKMFQHGQEFSKCALGLSELVLLMAHPLWMDTMVAMPALASQSSALPCCALSHPHRHTISVGQGHSKRNWCVSEPRTSCLCFGGEKEKEKLKMWSFGHYLTHCLFLFPLVLWVTHASDSSFYPARDPPDSLQVSLR